MISVRTTYAVNFLLPFQNELKELEDKFKKAMVANAGLDNEKSALNYQVIRIEQPITINKRRNIDHFSINKSKCTDPNINI